MSLLLMSLLLSLQSMISDDHVLRCGNLLRTLLMCIRHRGAFSAVYPAYISLCSRLLKSSNQKIAEVPLSWLEVYHLRHIQVPLSSE